MATNVWKAGVLAFSIVATAACSDSEFVSAPEAGVDGAACTTADCATFRSLDMASINAPLATATTIAQTSVQDKGMGALLAQRLTALRADLEAGRQASARIGLSALLSDLRGAEAAPTMRGDIADFAAIRLNLEPLVIKIGLK